MSTWQQRTVGSVDAADARWGCGRGQRTRRAGRSDHGNQRRGRARLRRNGRRMFAARWPLGTRPRRDADMTGPRLPDGFAVQVDRRVKVLGEGSALLGGSPTRLLRLAPAAQTML